ncbi:MAG: helix-turn-helix domain-containing protein [Clostridia bacterium]|nr:helix-turn-helix domain-containing protein [Clostridia bacterium]
MIFVPRLRPIIDNTDVVLTEIFYESRFTTIDDARNDGEHIHDFYEIYVNLAGDVSFLVEDNLYAIARGDIILSAPNKLHRCIYHSDCVHEHFCVWMKDIPYAPLKEQMKNSHKIVLPDQQRDALIQHCFTFNNCHDDPSLQFRAAQSFFGILDIISSGAVQSQTGPQILPEPLSEIMNYISSRFKDPTCTTTQICKDFYISKSTLCRRFHRYLQTTPSDYIESKRLSEAKKLLLTGHSVQNACISSGFSDCSYFIMRFRRKFGITPYRFQKEFI